MPQGSSDYSALFDDDQPDYAALFDDGDSMDRMEVARQSEARAEYDPPYDLMTDVGPQSDEPMSAASAAMEGLNDAVPFARDLDAIALGSGPEIVHQASVVGSRSPKEAAIEIMDAATKRKASGVERGARARDEHPLAYYAANVPAAIGAGLFGGAVSGGSKAAELATLLGQGQNHGKADPSDVALPLAAGKVIGAGAKVGTAIVRGIAEALKVPLSVAESLFARFGATKLAKMIAGEDKSAEGKVISDRVAALRAKIDASESFSPEKPRTWSETRPGDERAAQLATDAENGKATIGPGPRDWSGNPDLEGGMLDDAAFGAMDKKSPGFDADNVLQDELELLKLPPVAAPKPEPMPPPKPPTEASEAVTKNVVVAPGSEPLPTKSLPYGNKYAKGPLSPEDQALQDEALNDPAGAIERLKAELGGGAEIHPNQRLSSGDRDKQWSAVKSETESRLAELQREFVSKAAYYQKLLQRASAADSQNRMEAARLRGLATAAKTELDNIGRGRAALEKALSVASRIAGAASGGAAGYAAAGTIGAVGGAAAGARLGKVPGADVFSAAESATKAGRALSSWASAHAEQWAARGDAIGKLAQWALSGSGAGQELRMFMLGKAAEDGGEDHTD